MNCPPNGPAPGAPLDLCAEIPNLYAAYYKLMGGNARAEVRYRDRVSTYHRGDVKALRMEIRQLEILCGPPGGRAVRAGPAPGPMSPFGGYGPRGRW